VNIYGRDFFNNLKNALQNMLPEMPFEQRTGGVTKRRFRLLRYNEVSLLRKAHCFFQKPGLDPYQTRFGRGLEFSFNQGRIIWFVGNVCSKKTRKGSVNGQQPT